MDLLSTLETEGYTFGGEDKPRLNDEWDLEITEDTKKKLESKAMRMSRPVRDRAVKTKSEQQKDNKKVDAMDVLLGLANYN